MYVYSREVFTIKVISTMVHDFNSYMQSNEVDNNNAYKYVLIHIVDSTDLILGI